MSTRVEAQQTKPDTERTQADDRKLGGADAVALQCVTSVIATFAAQTLGPTLVGQLIAAVMATLLGAFLAAPTKRRPQRFVAVALFLALLETLGRGGSGGRGGTPRPSGTGSGVQGVSWAPTSWAAIGLAATVGFAGGSGITTARDAWKPAPDRQAMTVTVPRVHGQAIGAARKQLVGRGFRVSMERTRSERVAGGHVVRTEPPGRSRAEKGSPVTVVVSAGRRLVRVPPVAGLSQGKAVATLRDLGIGVAVERERSERFAKGDAMRTGPPTETRIERGSTVTLVISNWYRVTVPEVTGLTEGEAHAVLAERSLGMSTVGEETIAIPGGAVVGSDPPAGERVEGGSTVSVAVAFHVDRDCDFESQEEAQRYFEALGGPAEDPDELDGDGDHLACE